MASVTVIDSRGERVRHPSQRAGVRESVRERAVLDVFIIIFYLSSVLFSIGTFFTENENKTGQNSIKHT